MIEKDNFIVLGSTGRNTGKTEFACRLIKKYKNDHKIVGVKVVAIDPNKGNCPRGGKGCGVCVSLKGEYEIFEENNIDPTKDTSRMLMEGAHKVFFLKVRVDALKKGVNELLKHIDDDAMVVCESNSLREVLEPGLFIVIKNLNEKKVKESCAEVIEFASKVVEFNNNGWDFDPQRVLIKNNKWIIREKASAIILAGGKSSRMGQDKSLMKVNGKPLIEKIVKQLEGHFDEIIIGANKSEKYQFLKLPVVPDIETNKGSLMGICSCLKASSNEINFVTACDIPVMNTKLIHNMINISYDTDIVMPVKNNDKHEPLYAIYKKSVADKAELVLKNNGRRIIELLNYVKFKLISFEDKGWYQNLNVKDDYLKFIKKNKSDK